MNDPERFIFPVFLACIVIVGLTVILGFGHASLSDICLRTQELKAIPEYEKCAGLGVFIGRW